MERKYLITTWARSEILVRKVEFLDAQRTKLVVISNTPRPSAKLGTLDTDHESSESSMKVSCWIRDAMTKG